MNPSKPLLALAALAALSLVPAAQAADTVASEALQPKVGPALDSAGEGRRQFLRLNCYSCHGMFAAGGMGPDIVGAEHGDVSEAVLQGEDTGMPSFRNYVNSTDITNLTAYLDSIGKPGSPVFMDWWVKNPKK